MSLFVITFEVGEVLEDSEWQAPEYCFTDKSSSSSSSDGGGTAGYVEPEVDSHHDVVHVLRHLNLLSQM